MLRRIQIRSPALLIVLLAAWSVANAAQARWLAAESPLFVVYSDGDEARLRQFTQRLEEFDVVLRMLTRTSTPASPNRLHIYLVDGARELAQVGPYEVAGVRGFYVAASDGTLAVAYRDDMASKALSAQAILLHEYTHHFVAQYAPGAYPAWYNEGFAEYLSAIRFTDDGFVLGAGLPSRVAVLNRRPWLPIEAVIAPPPGVGLQTSDAFYAESWLATDYLMSDPERTNQLIAYLKALRRGEDAKVAFPKAFAMDFDAFQTALQGFAKRLPLQRVEMRPPAPPPIVVTALPAAAGALLLDAARLQVGQVEAADKPALLAKIRAEAADFPDDPLALLTTARAEILCGDPAKADPPLDKRLAAAPNDVEALYLKALRYTTAADADPDHRADLYAQARPYLDRAVQVDPNHYPSLYLYGTALASQRRLTVGAVDMLVRANRLAPQVEPIALATARVLLRARRYAEADALLQPIITSPHPGPLAAGARALLLAIKQQVGDRPPAAPDAGEVRPIAAMP